jgi:hypothetical protein
VIDVDAIPLDLPAKPPRPLGTAYVATVRTFPDGSVAIVPHHVAARDAHVRPWVADRPKCSQAKGASDQTTERHEFGRVADTWPTLAHGPRGRPRPTSAEAGSAARYTGKGTPVEGPPVDMAAGTRSTELGLTPTMTT